MQIEKKERYTLISSDENTFTNFFNAFSEIAQNFNKEHIILKISDKINVTKEEFLLFLDISAKKKENKTSFVIIYKNINADDFPDDFNIVPTLIEAEDVLEMEDMERELGL